MNEGLDPRTVRLDVAGDDRPNTPPRWFTETEKALDRGLRRMAATRPGMVIKDPGFRAQAAAGVAGSRHHKRRLKELDEEEGYLDGSDYQP